MVDSTTPAVSRVATRLAEGAVRRLRVVSLGPYPGVLVSFRPADVLPGSGGTHAARELLTAALLSRADDLIERFVLPDLRSPSVTVRLLPRAGVDAERLADRFRTAPPIAKRLLADPRFVPDHLVSVRVTGSERRGVILTMLPWSGPERLENNTARRVFHDALLQRANGLAESVALPARVTVRFEARLAPRAGVDPHDLAGRFRNNRLPPETAAADRAFVREHVTALALHANRTATNAGLLVGVEAGDFDPAVPKAERAARIEAALRSIVGPYAASASMLPKDLGTSPGRTTTFVLEAVDAESVRRMAELLPVTRRRRAPP
jgi:hypothetical protein